MINEEGLPIHEIREDTDGRPLGAIPTKPSDVQDEALAPLDVEKPADDFWSEAAVARRAALRRRIFHEGDNGDDEGDQPQLSAEPEEFADPTTPSIPSTPIRPPSPICRPSPTSQPKSILKQSARKKSVSFDESVPIPPDSPDHSGMSARIGGVVLPMPNGEFEPRPVPVIAEPKPAVKSQVGEKGFAGFKRGFLGGPSKPKTTTAALRTGPRKSSLFAQRMAQPEEELPSPTASATTVISMSSAETRPTVNLPKMSESKQMASMKPAVIERAVSRPSEPETTTTTSIASSSNASIARNGNTSHPVDTDQDEEDDYDDPSDEDEYDFDDALLAREAALEFHRRRGYQSFNPDDPDEEGGVMLALPQIADGKRIVNPTPDDPRKFVRVGKLENGKLVLAPGQVGWSDSEDEGDGDGEVDAENREGRGRKREMKRRLLGLEGDEPPIRAAEAKSHVEEETLPPAVTPIVREANKPTQSNPSPSLASPAPPPDPAPAKKVSRFKAARMGI